MANPSMAELADRVLSKCEPAPCPIEGWSDCLIFTGAKAKGYGRVGHYVSGGGQKVYQSHRVVWMAVRGPIPTALTIEHGCTVRACQNLEHMELMTLGDNTRAGAERNPIVLANRAKTHCPRNHPYDEENTYIQPDGGRYCRACGRERTLRWYHESNYNERRKV
jgi:hypothetical protein